jgi:nicotinate-nucleotide pyrophosphorylase (carboxylating)
VAGDFRQIEWDAETIEDCRQIVRLAIREDLEREHDWTTIALVSAERIGAADIVAREAGIVAGTPVLALAIEEFGATISLDLAVADGQALAAGTRVATIRGSARDLLTAERTLLNLLGRMMGIATLTRTYVDAVAGTRCRVYDTRKTTPGWRRLEKYAVHSGGGHNHRMGLYDAVLIKDNHLAQFGGPDRSPATAASAVRQAREFLAAFPNDAGTRPQIIEVEVDSLEQLTAVLAERPDIVLLDNMTTPQLEEAVQIRDRAAPGVELEASGGVNLETIGRIAATGVDRVSVGALTHSAQCLDVALDYASGDSGG